MANEAVSALMPFAVDRQTGLSKEGQHYVFQHTRFHFQNVQADEVNLSMPAVACRATLVIGEHQAPMRWRISSDSLDTADGVFVSTMDFQPQVTDAFHAAAQTEMRGLEEARAKLRDAIQE
ncbi:hypothetical protein G7A66_04740 [Altererythrobacter sp. SALINAS58]|uniref:hypothetical protein n=1 Tax=Alteripontixanthobacter muriae TaxID=2705546 RepID=UPI0019D66309|nr:hypothetical protein [Alteripontixanthobacter muriae]NTZ42407.1 hypothetical protein [Alteripontixanthobacter muriae]